MRPSHARDALGLVSLACVLFSAPVAAAVLTRGPYLQLLTSTSVTVVWNTDTPARCSLTIGPVGHFSTTLTGERGVVCAITVDGLDPGGEYRYVPRADTVPLRGESTFRADDPHAGFTMLVLGDSGDPGPSQDAVRDRMLATPADLIVHTGDMVYPNGAAEDFDPAVFGPYADLIRRVVLWPCLGNHDYRTDAGQPWRDAFYTPANNHAGSENYYSFDRGDAHFVVLDSNEGTSPGSDQYTFLDEDLTATSARWKFVVFHHPVYSSGTVHGGTPTLRANLVPLFDAHAVDVVFTGHEHNYERTLPLRAGDISVPGSGTVYITTGGGGKDLYPLGDLNGFTAYAESVQHFVRVVVDGDTLHEEMITTDGSVRDSMTLVKGAGATTTTTSTTVPNTNLTTSTTTRTTSSTTSTTTTTRTTSSTSETGRTTTTRSTTTRSTTTSEPIGTTTTTARPDDVTTTTVAPPGTTSTTVPPPLAPACGAGDCDDGDACTLDRCTAAGECRHDPLDLEVLRQSVESVFPADACAGRRLPKRLLRLVKGAGVQIAAAAEPAKRAGARRLVVRALERLRKGRRMIETDGGSRLGPSCAAALRARLGVAEQEGACLRAAL